ncbi:hypothetical protein Taro_029637 [Colocasia esculenta]|uniref:RRM domain-containing protein n=1 Tax=Colocasia esculenta TaxID=4460 RepID=A0A843VVG4_COLES|nr:hypothetical protein [Colocasia esculenta]
MTPSGLPNDAGDGGVRGWSMPFPTPSSLAPPTTTTITTTTTTFLSLRRRKPRPKQPPFPPYSLFEFAAFRPPTTIPHFPLLLRRLRGSPACSSTSPLAGVAGGRGDRARFASLGKVSHRACSLHVALGATLGGRRRIRTACYILFLVWEASGARHGGGGNLQCGGNWRGSLWRVSHGMDAGSVNRGEEGRRISGWSCRGKVEKPSVNLSSVDALYNIPTNTVSSKFGEDEHFESLEEIEAQTIGDLLPDDDDLLSGVIDDLGFICQPNSVDDMEDDLFCSGGGMELEAEDFLNGSKSSDPSNGALTCQNGILNTPFAGEHPYGEHPSRTLFVRNINSNVEDSELRALFEQYGDVRTLYTACKHRGFVMISYYDIRSARNAMRALQNKPLRRRKLDIHFSIPKDNPSEKDINQGTLVVFNLDSSIRETPHKHHHKFIEFYDVRAAEAALLALNRSDIAGKRIKLEPSRPGGARRLMQQFSPELEQEEANGCHQKISPPNDSSSGGYGSITVGAVNGLHDGSLQVVPSTSRAPVSPFVDNTFPGISSGVPHGLSSPIRVTSAGSHCSQSALVEPSHSLGQIKFGLQSLPTLHSNSLPEYHDGLANGISYNSPRTMSSRAINISCRPPEAVDNKHIHRAGLGGPNSQSYEHNEGVFGTPGNGSCPLHGNQHAWSNSNSFHHSPGHTMWSNSPSFVSHIPVPSQLHGLPRGPSHMPNAALPLHDHHVGSAPAVNPSVWDQRHAYAGEATNSSGFHPGSLGNMGFSGNSVLHHLEFGPHNIFPLMGGNCIEPSTSPHVGLPSPQQRFHMFHGRNPMIPIPASLDAPNDRAKSRRSDVNSSQADNKKQYELDIDRIIRGEDSRTTLMIKNIPNKYTSKMLLAAIDEHHRGTYDFIYLPIDFKNKCNVGYAFINMIDPQKIIPFFQAFNGKKWEKFNSEKVASLAYARIQGKASLIAHFQNSSLMNEDKRCRPILFHTDGPNAGDPEPFPMGVNIRSRPGRPRTSTNEDNNQGGPPNPTNGEESSNGAHPSSGSTKDPE